ncbi:hypothetical protein BH780_gp178 [Bacillus phage Eldridge]|uniref:Uncharacterized protein n=1 Tax=Bacillus phage Eldridge TaxID=1776293 RepID=A0A109ZVT6_9CAUD|nr:hypothetical protein BH780_gp178 [Bacillus phage Eldridge]AMB18761.1 hypothetical protein Eldridge_0181 [Bacillus phage Eldridge]
MLYIVALVLSGIIGYKAIDNGYEFEFMDWVLACVMGFVAFIVLGLVVIGLSTIPEANYKLIEESKIYALKDKSGTEGSFFLGSGQIKDEQKYFFIREQEGGKVMDSIDMDEAILYEGAKETKVEKYEAVIKNKVARFLFTSASPRGNKYKLYIPEGSITADYKVDME